MGGFEGFEGEFLAALRQDPTFTQLRDQAEQEEYAQRFFPRWIQDRSDAHKRSFPLNDNRLALLFLVQSDRLVSALTNQGYRVETYTYPVVRQTFAATRTGLQDPNIRHSSHKKDRHGRRDQRRKRGGRNFLILDQGEYDGAEGVWLQDEDTLEKGFLALEDDTVFWMVDENEAFVARRFKKGRRPRMRPGSPGRAKGSKRKSRGRFRSFRGKGRANQAEHIYDPADSSYYGKGKGKGIDKGGKGLKGKGKGKNKGDKGSSFKGTKG